MNDKEAKNISCKDCVYYNDYIGTGMCYHTNGWKQALALMMVGPRPLVNTEPCTFMKQQANQAQR